MEYNFTTTVRNKKINFREWKVKDFVEYSSAKTEIDKKKALVYNCVKDCPPLDYNEFEYLLFCIRNVSMPDVISKYTFKCKNCNNEYNAEILPSQYLKQYYEDYAPVDVGGIVFEFSDIRNQAFYDKVMNDITSMSKKILVDLVLHLSKIGQNEDFTSEEALEVINNLTVNQFEKLILAWDRMKLKFDVKKAVVCPHCGESVLMNFDYIEDFYPKVWVCLNDN